jgi:hypothetical protein
MMILMIEKSKEVQRKIWRLRLMTMLIMTRKTTRQTKI